MNRTVLKKSSVFSAIFLVLFLSIGFPSPVNREASGDGNEYPMDVDVSPHIINIESHRIGEIRIFTDFSYSVYMTSGDDIFIYVNESGPIQNVRPTRDSWGNLILKFQLSDLLNLTLETNATNLVDVAVVMSNGDEYIGSGDVYISTKRMPSSSN